MGLTDLVVLAAVAVAVVCCVRRLARPEKDGCAGCGSARSCSARAAGGACAAAEDMLRHAQDALGPARR